MCYFSLGRSIRLNILLMLAACFAAGCANAWLDEGEFPSSDLYSGFSELQSYVLDSERLFREKRILLGVGEYAVENPVVIDGAKNHIEIHGLDRHETRLVPLNKNKPLFIIKNGASVNFTSIHFDTNSRFVNHIEVVGDQSSRVELVDCFLEGAGIEINAPGEYFLQGTKINGQYQTGQLITLNNTDAKLWVFGGNFSQTASFQDDSSNKTGGGYHIWVRSGWLQVFGTGMQTAMGGSDIRIDSNAEYNSHQIINVRSEGDNGKLRGGSSLVLVPDGKVVDVEVINSAGSWRYSNHDATYLAKYHGEGLLKLIGNTASDGAVDLARSDGKEGFQLHAIGNTVMRKQERKLVEHNQYFNLYPKGRVFGRFVRKPYYDLSNEKAGGKPLVTASDITLPKLIERPVFDVLPKGLISVKAYGAKGDGKTNDWQALQRALNDSKHLYFPPGDYLIDKPLEFNSRQSVDHGPGGLIAGAGSRKTLIRGMGDHGLFHTDGMAYATMQGISFITKSRKEGVTAVSLENTQGIGHATQSNSFYDIRIEGGETGLGIGQKSLKQCSENLFVDVDIVEGVNAVAVGNFNALANIFYDVSIDVERDAFTHSESLSGGTWSVVNGDVKAGRNLMNLKSSANAVYFLKNVAFAGEKLVSTTASGANYHVYFDDVRSEGAGLDISAGGNFFVNSNGEGVSFYGRSGSTTRLNIFDAHPYAQFRKIGNMGTVIPYH